MVVHLHSNARGAPLRLREDSGMPAFNPYVRETGAGPGVVCLHSNASSSNQWRALMDQLAPRIHVLAADGYGGRRSLAIYEPTLFALIC